MRVLMVMVVTLFLSSCGSPTEGEFVRGDNPEAAATAEDATAYGPVGRGVEETTVSDSPSQVAVDADATTGSKKASQATGGSGDFHSVKWGDTLRGIAAKKYGSEKRWKRIYNANREKIRHPDRIYPRQKLKIPGAGGASK